MFNDDMIVDQINLKNLNLNEYVPRAIPISQEEYDLLRLKDPLVMYHIVDSKDGRMYLGDNLIILERAKHSYFLSPINKEGEYEIWLNERKGYRDYLIPIARFKDPQFAIDTLNRYSNVGGHTTLHSQIYNILYSYIDKDINIHDLLIGIIAIFGWRDSHHLQNLISSVAIYGVDQSKRDLPISLNESMRFWKGSPYEQNPLFSYYSDLYDRVVANLFYKDKEDSTKERGQLDLSKEIDEIFKIHFKYIR